ncbi:DUF5684 domain-containing protein [Plectonema radiosum NIES-515]|uniref:DUF5684 domain-containing protein n=1 Tax=Plectonema radiosum NIES-515 TaxID=2986073 RepID=A0ABT3ATM4_9CYAN|nr:DUF5684 domain-containing protein [Plectonema radiosum]MCV3212472.1 DUF5684 domain-containing protein [Plectonema radiosum NIES-515]
MVFLTSDWSSVYLLAQSNQSSDSAGGSFFSFIFGLAAYIFGSYCFYKIYQKLGEPNAWFAWVPILNNWIMYKAGDQSPWWTIGIFIPLVNFVALIFLIVAFVNIVKKLGKNPWLILLMIIPIINFVILYNFAFG